jgi:hypothetical protein
VDFGNCDADGAVRLVTRGTLEALVKASLELSDGMEIVLSDGELSALGTVSMRDGMWSAIVTQWFDGSIDQA